MAQDKQDVFRRQTAQDLEIAMATIKDLIQTSQDTKSKDHRLLVAVDKTLSGHEMKVTKLLDKFENKQKPPKNLTQKEQELESLRIASKALKIIQDQQKLVLSQVKRFKERVKKDHINLDPRAASAINDAFSCLQIKIATLSSTSIAVKVQKTLNKSQHKDKNTDLVELSALLEKIDNCLYRHFKKDPPISKEEYKKEISATTKKIDKIIDKHTSYKAKAKAVGKGFLGVLAAVTVYPALIVDAFTKKRYPETFFPRSPGKKLKHELGKVVQFKEEKPSKKDRKKLSQVTPLQDGKPIQKNTKKQEKWHKATEKDRKKMEKKYNKQHGLFDKPVKADKKQVKQETSRLKVKK